ncbi:Wzz/FepE/Etk N-terminal domain-containing protein, partial [Persephonella sp.]
MEKRNLPQPEPCSHNQQIVYYQEDEIDLYELFLTLKKRWKTVIAVLTVFIIAAVIYVVISRPIYKTDFLVKLPSISSGDRDIILSSPEETKAMVNNLNDLIKEKRYKKVSKLLDIPGKTVLNLNSISASSIKKNNRVVKITLEVYQPAEIPLLTEKLVDYMNNNRFVKERMRLKKEEITYSLKELKEKITEIQNIKDIILKKLEKGQIKNLGFNPLEMDEKIIGLKNRINTLENQL